MKKANNLYCIFFRLVNFFEILDLKKKKKKKTKKILYVVYVRNMDSVWIVNIIRKVINVNVVNPDLPVMLVEVHHMIVNR